MASPSSNIHTVLEHQLSPGAIVWPGSSSYDSVLKSYFSSQESDLSPTCFMQPSSAQEVSLIVQNLMSHFETHGHEALPFAVKSGGHTPWAGSANISNGVVIDLKKLDGVQVASDCQTAALGPGARWSGVYRELERHGLAVVGGRAGPVGVGGLLLGGGLSFFSPKQGFASDNVVEFEVVLATGQIVRANVEQHRELWLALKGGGNNFGIVTEFVVRSFPQGQLWGGITFSAIGLVGEQLDAFHEFTTDPDYDEHAVLIQSITYNAARGTQGIANNMHYTIPVERPRALRPFWSAPAQYETLRTSSLSDLATELGSFSPNGRRELYMTVTFKSDPQLLKRAYALYDKTIDNLKTVQNLFWALIFQPLPPAITMRTYNQRINPLGLGGSPPLVLALISSAWDLEHDSPLVTGTARELIADITQSAQERGLDHDFIYMNYAHAHQDPISGYGRTNREFLQRISHKYDPQGLFQKGCPGGFKIFR